MPENQYKEAEDKGASVAKPVSHTGWRATGGTHPLAPHLFSINETQRSRVNSGSWQTFLSSGFYPFLS